MQLSLEASLDKSSTDGQLGHGKLLIGNVRLFETLGQPSKPQTILSQEPHLHPLLPVAQETITFLCGQELELSISSSLQVCGMSLFVFSGDMFEVQHNKTLAGTLRAC